MDNLKRDELKGDIRKTDMSIQEMNINLQNPLFYEKKYFGCFLICFLGYGCGPNKTTVFKKALHISLVVSTVETN